MGFSEISNPTVQFGALFRYRKSYGAVRCYDISSYGAVRRGSSLNRFLYGSASLSVGKTAQHRFFSTVHRMNKPYENAVSYGSNVFSRGTNETAVFYCFSTVHRTNKPCQVQTRGCVWFSDVFLLLGKVISNNRC